MNVSKEIRWTEQQKGPRDASARYGTLSQNGYGAHQPQIGATICCCTFHHEDRQLRRIAPDGA